MAMLNRIAALNRRVEIRFVPAEFIAASMRESVASGNAVASQKLF
jgi:hypothetical protein